MENDDTCDKCPDCGAGWISSGCFSKTLLAYETIPGHSHDNNCHGGEFTCTNGHQHGFILIPRCPAEGCGWRGKTSCGICRGKFVKNWPAVNKDPGE